MGTTDSVKNLLTASRNTVDAGDLAFFNAVRTALPAFRGAELRKAAEVGTTLDIIKWLLSDQPLGRSERMYLAKLLAGELHTGGRKSKGEKQNQEDRDFAMAALELKERLIVNGDTATDAEAYAAEQMQSDPRARGRTANTIQRLMQDVQPTFNYLKTRNIMSR